MEFPSPTFEALPVELLFALLGYLPTSSLIALKLSSTRLFSKLPSPAEGWFDQAPTCERRAALRYLGEKKDQEYGRRRCVVCGAYAHPNDFVDSGFAPICKSHEGRLMTIHIPKYLEPSLKTRLENLAEDRKSTIWVAFQRRLCVHRKMIEDWDDIERKCECECDSCGHWPVWCYVRIPSLAMQQADFKPRSFDICNDEYGRHIIEEHDQFVPDLWPWQTLVEGRYRVSVRALELEY